MTALQFIFGMVAGAAAWGVFLLGVQLLVTVSERRKAAKRVAWNRRVGLALGRGR